MDFGTTGTSQTLSVSKGGGGTLTWSVSGNRSWLGVTPSSGSVTGETDTITVTVDRSGLGAGAYSGSVTLTSNGGIKTVSVIMRRATVSPVARFSMSSSGQTANQNQTLNLTVAPGGTATVNFSATTSYDLDGTITSYQWKINGTPVSTSQSFTFGLGAGTHQIFLTITDNSGLETSVGGTVVVVESRLSAKILSYGPSSVVNVRVGDATSLSVTFVNDGNVPWKFTAGATVWDSSGIQVANYSETMSIELLPGQQNTIDWDHTVNTQGDYWVQFGVWKYAQFTGPNLLDIGPSPSRKLISGQNFLLNAAVRTTTNLNVRTGPGTKYPEISDSAYSSFAPTGASGTVKDGPISSGGYVWWKVQFDPGYIGWCAENWLEKI
ncbi:MAG: hypothetical protein IIC96_19130 [Chloroflexi bacterium]|nr:hypothetical protein [Chloroflexota bacterium]